METNSSAGRTMARLARVVERSCGAELTVAQYRMLG
jgi:hypothetical protein